MVKKGQIYDVVYGLDIGSQLEVISEPFYHFSSERVIVHHNRTNTDNEMETKALLFDIYYKLRNKEKE